TTGIAQRRLYIHDDDLIVRRSRCDEEGWVIRSDCQRRSLRIANRQTVVGGRALPLQRGRSANDLASANTRSSPGRSAGNSRTSTGNAPSTTTPPASPRAST